MLLCFFFFKHKTAYEMRISDWSSDVCSSDLKCGTSKQAGQRIRSGHWQQHHTDERNMTPPIRIGIIGYGKIARDQHIPAIQASQDFQLAAISDPKPIDDAEAPFFQDYADMLAAQIVDAVAICTPPAPRHGIALACLETGYPLLLEKPPTVTLGEMEIGRAH